jgi:hypothetical protein
MMTKRNSVCGMTLFLVFFGLVTNAARPYAADSNVVERARAEGEVVLYTAWGFDTLQLLQKAFGKKYPFIKINVLRMRSERLLSRTVAEQKQKFQRRCFQRQPTCDAQSQERRAPAKILVTGARGVSQGVQRSGRL